MAKPSWRTLKSGDLLSIPLDGDLIAIGQVIDSGQEMYLCVYHPLFIAGQDIPPLAGTDIALIARTSDELLWHGQWTVIGHQNPPADVPRPFYVIDTPNGPMLRTYHGNDVRPATAKDVISYGHQFSVSNITFVKAMRHIHGIESYQRDFARITFGVVTERAALA
jgi:hypothetical protein